MRRIMISPPVDVLERISNIAAEERRSPKEQIEYVLIQYVREREEGNVSREVSRVG